jgi:DNA-binding transcriptional LysR family regulator
VHLPTTTALRVITALSQHGTVSAAAAALNMTQSAVSKQLKTVETLVGLALFERGRHGLVPTEAGVIYTEQARVAIGALETAAARTACFRHSRPVLRLHILPILGDRWFMPRLIGFGDLHPEIDVRFVTYYAQREVHDQVDVAFQFGAGGFGGWRSDYFFGRDVILVASPSALERGGGLRSPADIGRYRLLLHQQTPLFWEEFAAAAGLVVQPEQKVPLSYYALVIRGAIGGQGLALVPRVLIQRELQAGELVNPLGLGFPARNSYWLTTPEMRPREGATALFCAWALAEARRSEDPRFADPA